jgi:putative Mn2+ efflux pump MntP
MSAALWTPTYSNRKIFVLFLILIVMQAIDATIGNLADIFRDFAVSFWGVALFVGFSIIYCFGQYFLLTMIKAKNKEQEIEDPLQNA